MDWLDWLYKNGNKDKQFGSKQWVAKEDVNAVFALNTFSDGFASLTTPFMWSRAEFEFVTLKESFQVPFS